MDWENDLENNSMQVKWQHGNKKPLSKKRIFVQALYSHSTSNLEQKKFSRRKTARFFARFPVSAWPKSPLQFDFKNHENVWTDLKKRQRPNTIQVFWIAKKTQSPNTIQILMVDTEKIGVEKSIGWTVGIMNGVNNALESTQQLFKIELWSVAMEIEPPYRLYE